MTNLADAPRKLLKELRLFDVFALATGAPLSAGLFLLPGPAFASAGPAVVLAYLLAAIPLYVLEFVYPYNAQLSPTTICIRSSCLICGRVIRSPTQAPSC